ncbi:unnamed protein product [Mytilus edulis]|uniref:Uncharacterized protein n=1 Tax=Mytilus edulis TaxID=6550 RepID=A0A8S3SIV4_MYTED|nr:unnamed protein product [Mytilus edulis]
MIIVHDFYPLLPKAVYVTDDSIFVSTREDGKAWPLTEHSRRQIVVLGQTGKKKVSVIEYDKQNTRLFSLICRMTMDKTGNIVAVDFSSKDITRIVKVVNNSIEWIYEGNQDINTDEIPFNPFGLSITKMEILLEHGEDTHSLHILSEEGVLIKCCMMEDNNILLPYCLDFDSNGNLWIGCSTYENSEDNAKIHKLEISGC